MRLKQVLLKPLSYPNRNRFLARFISPEPEYRGHSSEQLIYADAVRPFSQIAQLRFTRAGKNEKQLIPSRV